MIRPSRPTFEFARPLVIAGEAAAALWEGLGRATVSSSVDETRLYESASGETRSYESASGDLTPSVTMEAGRQSPVLQLASGAPVWLTLDGPEPAAIPSMAAGAGENLDQETGAFAGLARVLLAVAVVFALAMGLWNATQNPVPTAGPGQKAVTPAMAAVGSNGLSSTSPSATYRTKQIGEIRTGQRVLARNPQLEQDEVAESEIDPATWRNIRLRMQKSNNGTLDIVLLRSLGWLEERAAEFDELYAIDPVDGVLAYKTDLRVSQLVSQKADLAQSPQSWTANESASTLAEQHQPVSTNLQTDLPKSLPLTLSSTADKDSRWIHLAFPEIGAAGPAVVLAIEPCPPLESGEGRIVTGTFAHSAANVIDLEIEGVETPIGCTANHPLWSEDQQDFVQAGSLKIGEQLRTESGHLVQVTRITPRRGPPVAVFNLEVDAEHVYYVSSAAVLVHNNGLCQVRGNPQYTSVEHATRMEETANQMAASGAYSEVYMHTSWNTILDGKPTSVTPNRLPDVVGVRLDGRIDIIEYASSARDFRRGKLLERNIAIWDQLPPEMRGDILVFDHNGLLQHAFP